MRKNIINLGFSVSMAILIVGLIILTLIPELQFQKEKTVENEIESGNKIEASRIEILSDHSLRFIAKF